jgi:peptidoglycan L-alanyl-D-glutamate endopeptidase CwlK
VVDVAVKFQFGQSSLRELEGVDDRLAAVVHRALELTEQDFSVHDGLRTFEEQQALVISGASHTLESKHLKGHAVDLVPYVNGKLRWEWEPIYSIARAMRQAAQELNVPIRWGAAWDVRFNETDKDPKEIANDYAERRRLAGRKPFLDGPHYELVT